LPPLPAPPLSEPALVLPAMPALPPTGSSGSPLEEQARTRVEARTNELAALRIAYIPLN
jgi:hypothetical protein